MERKDLASRIINTNMRVTPRIILLSLLVFAIVSSISEAIPSIIYRCVSFWLRGGSSATSEPSATSRATTPENLENRTATNDRQSPTENETIVEELETQSILISEDGNPSESSSSSSSSNLDNENTLVDRTKSRKRNIIRFSKSRVKSTFSASPQVTKASSLFQSFQRKRIKKKPDSNNSEKDEDEETSSSSSSSTSANALMERIKKLSSLAERKRFFLDRIALISSSLDTHDDADLQSEENQTDEAWLYHPQHLSDITPQSDLTLPRRHFYVVTTASLPWATGTAVNPLLRAAYLHRRTQQINNNNSKDDSNKNSSKSMHELKSVSNERWVTLVIPWLELPEDQQELYHRVFRDPAEQEEYIRKWLREEADMGDAACPDTGLQLLFYPARYHSGLRSIFAMGDIMSLMDNEKMDVCILEEPEHCNWFRAPGDGWTKRFHYVVGIVHTNYKEYASAHYSGLWTAPAIAMMSSAMVRAYCHKLIKLSPVLQTYAPEKESVSNVHGVRSDFLKEGLRRTQETNWPPQAEKADMYFIGKLLWAKGLDLMLELQDYYKSCTGEYFDIDIYGSGPDEKDIQRAFHGRKELFQFFKSDVAEPENDGSSIHFTSLSENSDATLAAFNATVAGFLEGNGYESIVNAFQRNMKLQFPRWGTNLHAEAKQRLATLRKHFDSVDLPKSFAELRRTPIPARFPGRVDHALLKDYKIFVNPSVSEVLCTTTAEALAMGKFVIIPAHPSNTFFMSFPNCLAYRNKFEFVANVRWAMRHDPEPLTPELAREFTWEAATDRLIAASSITWKEAHERERLGRSKLDERIAWFHNELGKGATGDMLRKIFGAGPAADQVKYTYEMKQVTSESESEEGFEEEDEDEDDGLTGKFRRSSFAEAIRATVADMASFIQ